MEEVGSKDQEFPAETRSSLKEVDRIEQKQVKIGCRMEAEKGRVEEVLGEEKSEEKY